MTRKPAFQLTAPPRSIGVIQTAFLGDVVFTSPLVGALKRRWPAARLTLVVTPKAEPIAAHIPGVDAVLTLDKRGVDSGLFALKAKARKLEAELVVVPHPSLRSALFAHWSGAPVRVGHEHWSRRRFYTVTVPLRTREPFTQRFLDLARAIGVEGDPSLALNAPAQECAQALAQFGGVPSVGLAIGSEWATKRWPPESFGRLAALIASQGWRPVLLGGPKERSLAQAVIAASGGAAVLDLVGNTIVESLGAMAAMRAVVGGDSGLVHAARALGTPTLLLFGPTDPGAHHLEAQAQALRLGLECQPCHAHGPKRCPRRHFSCMKDLAVERVWGALQVLLTRAEAA